MGLKSGTVGNATAELSMISGGSSRKIFLKKIPSSRTNALDVGGTTGNISMTL